MDFKQRPIADDSRLSGVTHIQINSILSSVLNALVHPEIYGWNKTICILLLCQGKYSGI